MSTPAAVLAVDIGGTKLAAGVVDRAGALSVRHVVPTPTTADADELFDTLLGLARAVAGTASLVAWGVGCGGPMVAGGERVSPLNIRAWRDFPLRARLVAATGLPTFVDNDAKALALGEGWMGAATGWSNSTLYDKMKVGKFPKPTRLDPNGRVVVWFADEVEAFQKRAVERNATTAGAR